MKGATMPATVAESWTWSWSFPNTPALGLQYDILSMLKRVIDIPTHEGYSLDALCLTLLNMAGLPEK